MKTLLAILTFCSAALLQAVEISSITAKQRWPWNNLVDIDFTLSAPAGEAYRVRVEAKNSDGSKTYLATQYANDPIAVNGKNRITWNFGADYPGVRANDIKFAVSVYPYNDSTDPLYLVIDLSAGPDAAKYPVRYSTKPPAHVRGATGEPCQTTELWFRRVRRPLSVQCLGWATDDVNSIFATQTKDYYIAVFELTQKQFALVTGLWPSKFANVSCRDSRPVENVIYKDHLTGIFKTIHSHADTISADSFFGRLRARTGLPFSLPTYAQWQWAAQGAIPPKGEFYIYYVNGQQPALGDVARCAANSTGKASSTDSDLSAGTAAVGTYVPNDLGLYDMLGNVEECTGEVLDVWNKHAIADEQAWLRETKGDATLGTKTNPLVDPAGRSDTETVYLRVMGGNYEGDSESITLWRTDVVESGNWKDNRKIGVRLSLTIE